MCSCSETDEERKVIGERAKAVRDLFNSGFASFLDSAKSVTGAAADEFSWFLGGDVDRAERDFWLEQAQKYQADIEIDEKTELAALMFIASIAMPSADDAWKMISEKASKEMLETVGEKGAKKFYKAVTKYAGKTGENGIKKLSGNGIKIGNKTYQYEVKVIGNNVGKYRLLGNINESGDLVFETFQKTH